MRTGSSNQSFRVPARDELVSPFAAHDVVDAVGRGAGHRAEGVAVEIDAARRQREPVAERRERVDGVGGDAVLAGEGGGGEGHGSSFVGGVGSTASSVAESMCSRRARERGG